MAESIAHHINDKRNRRLFKISKTLSSRTLIAAKPYSKYFIEATAAVNVCKFALALFA